VLSMFLRQAVKSSSTEIVSKLIRVLV
jgi:hypothetical protein